MARGWASNRGGMSVLSVQPRPASDPGVAVSSRLRWHAGVNLLVVGWMAVSQQSQPGNTLAPMEVAQSIPAEYLMAHQSSAPSASSYYIQPVNYAE